MRQRAPSRVVKAGCVPNPFRSEVPPKPGASRVRLRRPKVPSPLHAEGAREGGSRVSGAGGVPSLRREMPSSRGIKGPAPPARDAVPPPSRRRQRGGKLRQRCRGVYPASGAKCLHQGASRVRLRRPEMPSPLQAEGAREGGSCVSSAGGSALIQQALRIGIQLGQRIARGANGEGLVFA